jgi:hypothetical protein
MTVMIDDRLPGTGLAQHEVREATVVLPPPLDGSIPGVQLVCAVAALLLEAIACDALGDPDAARSVLERALDLAERDRALFPFLIHPVPRSSSAMPSTAPPPSASSPRLWTCSLG